MVSTISVSTTVRPASFSRLAVVAALILSSLNFTFILALNVSSVCGLIIRPRVKLSNTSASGETPKKPKKFAKIPKGEPFKLTLSVTSAGSNSPKEWQGERLRRDGEIRYRRAPRLFVIVNQRSRFAASTIKTPTRS